MTRSAPGHELQGLVETYIHEQVHVRRKLTALESGTSPWQREVSEDIQHIRGAVEKITDKIQFIQWTRASIPYVLAFFGGGIVCCSILIWVITHH